MQNSQNTQYMKRKYATTGERVEAFINLMSPVYQPVQCENLAKQLEDMGFFDAPASTKYHGSWAGGLYEHSEAVTKNLVYLTEKLDLKWERDKSPYLVGILHDLCKADQYTRNYDGTWAFAPTRPLPGHGEKSVILAQKIVDLTEEEILCIRWHMGGYDDSKNWNICGAAIELYQNVLWTHTADMMASRVQGI